MSKNYYNPLTDKNEAEPRPGLMVSKSSWAGRTWGCAYGYVNENGKEVMSSRYGGNMGYSAAVHKSRQMLGK